MYLNMYVNLILIGLKRNFKAALPNPFNKYTPLIMNNLIFDHPDYLLLGGGTSFIIRGKGLRHSG